MSHFKRRGRAPSLDPVAGNGLINRRALLGQGIAVAGAMTAGAAGTLTGAAAEPIKDEAWSLEFGSIMPAVQVPSWFEKDVVRTLSNPTGEFRNPHARTPHHLLSGTITPNSLHFSINHSGVPDIDPAKHKLVIHGMVRQPLEFTLDDLMRYPSASKFYFMECSGNGLTDWLQAASTTVQQTHGLLSCAQWTGIPVSWLLDEAGLGSDAKWLLFEGADGAGHVRSMPLKKVLDDCLLVYAQNGEMLRPEQGYPVRLFVPGWEGNVSVKWLRRIKVGDEPWHFRSETARYTDPMPDGMWRQFSFEMECKSVVTRPSGGMTIQPGMHEIQGFAWSGNGKIRAVDVTTDGGKNWQEARLEEPVLDKCLTRFRFPWDWKGGPANIASRAVDSTGYVQPTVQELAKVRAIVGFVQHHNGVFPWSVSAGGEVKNAIA